MLLNFEVIQWQRMSRRLLMVCMTGVGGHSWEAFGGR